MFANEQSPDDDDPTNKSREQQSTATFRTRRALARSAEVRLNVTRINQKSDSDKDPEVEFGQPCRAPFPPKETKRPENEHC